QKTEDRRQSDPFLSSVLCPLSSEERADGPTERRLPGVQEIRVRLPVGPLRPMQNVECGLRNEENLLSFRNPHFALRNGEQLRGVTDKHDSFQVSWSGFESWRGC